MEVRCTNKECLHEWDYRGRLGDNDYITCSKCRYKSLIRKAKITDLLTDLNKENNKNVSEKLTDLSIKQEYKKEIVKPDVEHVEKEHYSKEKESEEEISNPHFQGSGKNLCEEHNLPARYESDCKKWICAKCPESKIEINKRYKPYEKNLGTCAEINKEISVTQIPYNPLAALHPREV